MTAALMITTEFSQRPADDLSVFNDINMLLSGLHVWLLKRIGLRALQLSWHADTLSSLHNLPSKLTQCLVNIFMESCKNSLEHSNADRIEVQCVELRINNKRGFAISVCDNGTGYDTKTIRHGSGLVKIYSNAAALGADIVVISDSAGTQVKLWIPAFK